jgi:hypothetical protein
MVPRLAGLRRPVATQIPLQTYGKLDFKLQGPPPRVNPKVSQDRAACLGLLYSLSS